MIFAGGCALAIQERGRWYLYVQHLLGSSRKEEPAAMQDRKGNQSMGSGRVHSSSFSFLGLKGTKFFQRGEKFKGQEYQTAH